jgi:hypothetical protein
MHMTGPSPRRIASLWAALLVACAPVLVTVPLVSSWRDRLPARLATHWTVGSRPDGFMGRDAFLDGWVVASLVVLAIGVLVVLLLRRGRRAAVTVLAAGSAFLASLGLMVALPNLDLSDPQQARIGWVAALPLALMAVFAGLAWWIHGKADGVFQPATSPPAADLPRLAADEEARYDRSETLWWMAIAMFGLLGLLGVALWILISPWLGIELIVLGFALALLARTRVRVSADHELALSSGPITHRVPIAELTGARVVDHVDPFGEYGGWGLRYVPGTVAMVTRKGAGVEIGRTDDRRVVITCADPERLAATVNTLADRRFPLPTAH